MNYKSWMAASNRGPLKPRSRLLKAIDKAVSAYDKSPSPNNLQAIDQAIMAWCASKANWRQSIRANAVINLMMHVRRRQGAAVGAAAASHAARVTRRRNDGEYQVAINGQQTLHYPSPDYDDYCNQWFGGNHDVPFPMTVNFGIVQHGTAFVINVRALATPGNGIGRARQQTALSHWKTHCERTWNIAVVYVGQTKYDLIFNLQWVQPGAPRPYYELEMHQPPPPANSNLSRDQMAEHHRSGTPHLAQWGVDDKQAVAHEFGHMIGNPDEYLCVGFNGLAQNWSAAIHNNPAFSTDSIMNNTASNGCRVYERHFAMVVQEIRNYLQQTLLVVPQVRVAIERPIGTPGRNEFIVSQAIQARRRAMGYDDD